jgi:hypothetical protein
MRFVFLFGSFGSEVSFFVYQSSRPSFEKMQKTKKINVENTVESEIDWRGRETKRWQKMKAIRVLIDAEHLKQEEDAERFIDGDCEDPYVVNENGGMLFKEMDAEPLEKKIGRMVKKIKNKKITEIASTEDDRSILTRRNVFGKTREYQTIGDDSIETKGTVIEYRTAVFGKKKKAIEVDDEFAREQNADGTLGAFISPNPKVEQERYKKSLWSRVGR